MKIQFPPFSLLPRQKMQSTFMENGTPGVMGYANGECNRRDSRDISSSSLIKRRPRSTSIATASQSRFKFPWLR